MIPDLQARRAAARERAASRTTITIPGPALDLPLRGSRVVILDTETTGIDPAEARIVEVSAVVVASLGTSDPEVVFTSRVRPGVPIPEGATKIHGISDADVADAPTWPEVWPRLVQAIGPDAVVAGSYNSVYDHGVILAELERHRLPATGWAAPDAPWVDPFVLVRSIDQYKKGKQLSDAAERRGVVYPPHGATADAVVAAHLLPLLLAEAARGPTDQRGRTRWRMPRGMDLRGYAAWQLQAALTQERDLAEYNKREIDAPWHRRAGLPAPVPTVKAPDTARCSSCGSEILWVVSSKGTRSPVEVTPHRIVSWHEITSGGVADGAPRKGLHGFTGSGELVAGPEVPDDWHPEIPRVELRESHFAHCPHAFSHRRKES